MRPMVLGVLAFVGAFLLAAVVLSAPKTGAIEAHSLSIVVQRPAGPPALLQFKVAASGAAEARGAAERAALELVPGGTIERSTGKVSAQWAAWSWSWEPNELPVTVAYNPEGAAPTVGPHAIIAGLQAWSSVGASSFAFEYRGITDRVASILEEGPDGENVISWRSFDCAMGCVLGVASKELTHEVDLVLNNNPDAATQAGIGGKLDWQTVILHELGHVAGLEHSCPAPFGTCTDAEFQAVMYFQYSGVQRRLEEDDIAGLAALYPLAVGGEPPEPEPPMPVVVQRGWNLLLLPPGPVHAIAEDLACVRAVYSYEGQEWRAWVRGAPGALQDLTMVEGGRSYWVLGDAACGAVFGP